MKIQCQTGNYKEEMEDTEGRKEIGFTDPTEKTRMNMKCAKGRRWQNHLMYFKAYLG